MANLTTGRVRDIFGVATDYDADLPVRKPSYPQSGVRFLAQAMWMDAFCLAKGFQPYIGQPTWNPIESREIRDRLLALDWIYLTDPRDEPWCYAYEAVAGYLDCDPALWRVRLSRHLGVSITDMPTIIRQGYLWLASLRKFGRQNGPVPVPQRTAHIAHRFLNRPLSWLP